MQQILVAPRASRAVPKIHVERLQSGLAVLDELLRDREAFLARLERGENLGLVARTLIAATLLSGAAFGGSLGTFRGGPQILLAAVKLPAAALLTAAICAPVLTTMRRAVLGAERASVTKDIALVLTSIAFGMMVAASLSPLVLLARCAEVGYHRAVLVGASCAVIGGFAGLSVFVRSVRDLPMEPRRFITISVLLSFALVGTQASWILRPYLTRPQSAIVLIRPVQGNIFDSFVRSAGSAVGYYPAQVEPEKLP